MAAKAAAAALAADNAASNEASDLEIFWLFVVLGFDSLVTVNWDSHFNEKSSIGSCLIVSGSPN